MKLSTIGASIVAVASGLGAVLTVVEQWHNIEQWWNKPTPRTAASVASQPAPTPLAPVMPPAAAPQPAAVGLSGCFSGAVGSALAPFAQCGNLGPLVWGVNKLKICFRGEGGSQVTALFQEDRSFLAQSGISVMREHTATGVSSISGDSADLTMSYNRTDTNAFGMQVAVFVEASLSCRGGEGALDCQVQPQRASYAGVTCMVPSGGLQVSLAGE